MPESVSLEQFLEDKYRWSVATFGAGTRTVGILKHLREELDEIQEEPTDLREWIDVILLAFDGAMRQGFSAQAVVRAMRVKQAENEMRTWNVPDDDEPCHHVDGASNE